MVTISVCMIVKNEHDRIEGCLESLKTIADEIIVVDTGSTDDTMEIAGRYTDKIYEFKWTGSFADARNYSFSLAKCDYIYQADADELLDDANIEKFRQLKMAMLPEIDIVQMYYCNQLENNTIYNYDRELRPKLYKRLREFVWEESIHEAVRLEPIIYDSDIDIIHRPGAGHELRDLAAFERETKGDVILSDRLNDIYAKELYISGPDESFIRAREYFNRLADSENMSNERLTQVFAVCAKAARLSGDEKDFLKYSLRAAAGNLMCSEICHEIADYMEEKGDANEAAMWRYNAANETEPAMNLKYGE